MNTNREINAAVKKTFQTREGFKPVKTFYVGSIPAIRIESDMPVSLVCEIARWIEMNYPKFADFHGTNRYIRHIGFVEGGVVINWQNL